MIELFFFKSPILIAKAVAKAQADWRESQKQAAMARREKDKTDREKQKQSADERKK